MKEIESNVENDDKLVENVPFVVYESAMIRAERHIKRLWVALIIAILALFACNVAYLAYLSLYDFESYEITAQGDGHANYIGQDGDIYNGESSSSQES